MAHLFRVVSAVSLMLLTGSVNSWETSDVTDGTISTSPVASSLTLTASIESEGEYEGEYEGDFRIYLELFLSAETEGDECMDLTVTVRDEAGEKLLDESMADLELCTGLRLSPAADACAGQLPGRCEVTFEVEVSSPEALRLNWTFEASVMGTLSCNQDKPPTTVYVSQ